MKILRKVCIGVASAALSVGLLGLSAPAAEADSSWGGRVGPVRTP